MLLRTLVLFIGILVMHTYAAPIPCGKTMALKGKSDYHHMISEKVQYRLGSKLFYEVLLPSLDVTPDYTVVMHDVSIKPSADDSELVLTCDLELIKDGVKSLGREISTYTLLRYTSARRQENAIYKSCQYVVKSIFSRVRSCGDFNPHPF